MDILSRGVMVLLAGAVVWGVWRTMYPPPFFLVHLKKGVPYAGFGKVTQNFLKAVREIAAEHQVEHGRVWGSVTAQGRIILGFSPQFPESARQQLRNWWSVSGWTAGAKCDGCR